MLKNDSNAMTIHYTATDRNYYLQTDRLFCTGTVSPQDNCSPKEKKEKLPCFAFLKISFADTHLAHLLLPIFILNGMAKAKEPNYPNAQKINRIIAVLFSK